MNNDTKALLLSGVAAFLLYWVAMSFNFVKGTPTIIVIVTFTLLYFMKKLERIENKLDEIGRRKRK